MIRNPIFNDLFSLRDTVDHLFQENPFGSTFGNVWSRSEPRRGANVFPMPLDIYSTDDEAVVLAAVPGMLPEDLDLTIHKNTVTITGELKSLTGSGDGDEATESRTWYVRELGEGTYRRSVTLPFAVDADHAEATFEHGVLRIVLPKAEDARPRKVAIQSGKHEAIESGSAG
jgi:HSP20 family protein